MTETELDRLRRELDRIDAELVSLFERRMAVSRKVAAWKKRRGAPVRDPAREAQVLESRAARAADPALRPAVRQLFEAVMALSRAEQEAVCRAEQEAEE